MAARASEWAARDRAGKCECALLRTAFSLAARFDPQCIACAALSLNSVRPVPARGGTHRHFLRLGLLGLLCLGHFDLLRHGLLRRLHRMRACNGKTIRCSACVSAARIAVETEYIQCVGADLRCLFSGLLLGLQNQSERQNCKARRGPTPTQILGVRKCRKKSVRDYGRIECASQFGARDGAGVQVRGAKRDGDARRRACVRAPRGVQKRVVQPAAEPRRSAQRPELSSSSRRLTTCADARTCGCLHHTAAQLSEGRLS